MDNLYQVPFFKQTTLNNCGFAVLKMAFSYFGKDVSFQEFEEVSKIPNSSPVCTIELAYITALFGFKVQVFSNSPQIVEDHLSLDFYKKNSNVVDRAKYHSEKAKAFGIVCEEKSLSLKEILNFISDKSIPIVLLDWNVISPKVGRSYQGHFVPVVGYDSQHIIIHNSGLNDGSGFVKIEKDLFDKARKSKGTDEDVLVVFRG